jgi:hypothetical protein
MWEGGCGSDEMRLGGDDIATTVEIPNWISLIASFPHPPSHIPSCGTPSSKPILTICRMDGIDCPLPGWSIPMAGQNWP